MLITPHAAAGAALVILIPNQEIAFPAAFASHLVLDSIPHWDFTPDVRHWYRLMPDATIAVGTIWLMVWLSGVHWQLAVTGALLAILPDIIQQLNFIGRGATWLKPFFIFHNRVQRDATVLPGLMTQLAVILLCLLGVSK